MPLQRRLPKRGFKNPFRKEYTVVNIQDLDRFAADTTVDRQALKKAGLAKKRNDGIKLLGVGEISHPLRVQVNKISLTARQKIEAAGGTVEVV